MLVWRFVARTEKSEKSMRPSSPSCPIDTQRPRVVNLQQALWFRYPTLTIAYLCIEDGRTKISLLPPGEDGLCKLPDLNSAVAERRQSVGRIWKFLQSEAWSGGCVDCSFGCTRGKIRPIVSATADKNPS